MNSPPTIYFVLPEQRGTPVTGNLLIRTDFASPPVMGGFTVMHFDEHNLQKSITLVNVSLVGGGMSLRICFRENIQRLIEIECYR
jgi:hypothetical protein